MVFMVIFYLIPLVFYGDFRSYFSSFLSEFRSYSSVFFSVILDLNQWFFSDFRSHSSVFSVLLDLFPVVIQ